jgi:hypothetical protein
MRNFPPKVAFVLIFVCISIANFGQNGITQIANEQIGTLDCTYLKQVKNNAYSIQIVFKNLQYVYKQEADTILLNSMEKRNQFIADLKAAVLVLDNEEKSFQSTSDYYHISKDREAMNNKLLTFSSKDLTIKTTINKYFANQLIDWVSKITIGKE